MSLQKNNKKIKIRYPQESLEYIEYKNAKSPCKIKCLLCGQVYEFERAENATRKGKKCLCNKCFNNGSGGRLTLEKANERFKKYFIDEKIEVLEYKYMTSPCKIKCLSCGEIYNFNIANNVLSRKKLCDKCHPNKEEVYVKKRKVFLDFILNSSEFELQENLDFKRSTDLIKCKCKRCGKSNYKTINDYLRGRQCQCVSNNAKKTLKQYQNELEEGYLVLEYNGMNNVGKFKHECGFIYNAKPVHHKCPRCKKVKSKGEKEILQLLKKYYIDYEQEYGVVINGHNLRFDFYLPQYNTFIEYQGIQHFEPVKYFGGEEKFKKQQSYDQMKRRYCKDNNINLLEIKYNDNIEKTLLKTFKVQRPSQI